MAKNWLVMSLSENLQVFLQKDLVLILQRVPKQLRQIVFCYIWQPSLFLKSYGLSSLAKLKAFKSNTVETVVNVLLSFTVVHV